jgi:hypothetical protein
MLARIRKAITAGVWGGLSAAASTIVITGAPTKDDVSKALGAFIVGAAVTGYATYRAKPNAPAA